MRHLWLLLPLLLTACVFDRSGLVTGDASTDIAVTDSQSVDLVTRSDTSLDILDSDASDPCTPNPCQNGGTCVLGDGGAVCQCAPGFDGPSCGVCALGYSGPSCAPCPETKLAIQTCTHAFINCDKWIDGDNDTMTWDSCSGRSSGCFASDFDFDLGSRRFVHRIRFLSDWWQKRPVSWELWASDDKIHYSLVMTAASNEAPWQCVTGELCTVEVPKECCPGGGPQDTTGIGVNGNFPKWDDFTFSGVAAQHWRFYIMATDDPEHLDMRELELYGHDCLGDLACATSSCGTGVCTGQESEICTCAGCQPPADCTSAFTGVAPPCATPPP